MKVEKTIISFISCFLFETFYGGTSFLFIVLPNSKILFVYVVSEICSLQLHSTWACSK